MSSRQMAHGTSTLHASTRTRVSRARGSAGGGPCVWIGSAVMASNLASAPSLPSLSPNASSGEGEVLGYASANLRRRILPPGAAQSEEQATSVKPVRVCMLGWQETNLTQFAWRVVVRVVGRYGVHLVRRRAVATIRSGVLRHKLTFGSFVPARPDVERAPRPQQTRPGRSGHSQRDGRAGTQASGASEIAQGTALYGKFGNGSYYPRPSAPRDRTPPA